MNLSLIDFLFLLGVFLFDGEFILVKKRIDLYCIDINK